MNQEVYLDIETTGLSPHNHSLTVIGLYICDGFRENLIQLVGSEITTNSLIEPIATAATIYTYNGTRFDLPFLRIQLGVDLLQQFKHCDLMLRCRDSNLYGGLKTVEKRIGYTRTLKDIDGQKAIKLWDRFINYGDRNALNTLLVYNREDLLSLKAIRHLLVTSMDE